MDGHPMLKMIVKVTWKTQMPTSLLLIKEHLLNLVRQSVTIEKQEPRTGLNLLSYYHLKL